MTHRRLDNFNVLLYIYIYTVDSRLVGRSRDREKSYYLASGHTT